MTDTDILPASGWTFLRSRDHGGRPITCAYCGNPKVRYEYLIYHFDRALPIGVCWEVCYPKLTGDRTGERRHSAPLEDWCDLRHWKPTAKGYRREIEGGGVTVFRKDGAWKWVLNGRFSRYTFQTCVEAMSSVFRVLNREPVDA
jgi:hypothetical protein